MSEWKTSGTLSEPHRRPQLPHPHPHLRFYTPCRRHPAIQHGGDGIRDPQVPGGSAAARGAPAQEVPLPAAPGVLLPQVAPLPPGVPAPQTLSPPGAASGPAGVRVMHPVGGAGVFRPFPPVTGLESLAALRCGEVLSPHSQLCLQEDCGFHFPISTDQAAPCVGSRPFTMK